MVVPAVAGLAKNVGSKVIEFGPGSVFAWSIVWRRLPNPESLALNTVKFGTATVSEPIGPARTGFGGPFVSKISFARISIE